MNEPVSPDNEVVTKVVGIGGLADEKRLKENEEALDAAYEDEDGPAKEPFWKKMRKKGRAKAQAA